MNFFNSRGSATVQMIVAGSLLLGAAAYVANKQLTQKKQSISVDAKKVHGSLIREIGEALIQNEICLSTFTRNGPLTANMPFQGVYNSSGQVMYGVDSVIYNRKINSMVLEGYTTIPDSTPSTQELNFSVTTEDVSTKKLLGSRISQQSVKVRLTTQNNVVISCLNDQSGLMKLALIMACQNLGGTYNSMANKCDNLHGDSGPMAKFAKSNLCGESQDCKHPYANQVCSGTDLRGKDWGNWVVAGFKTPLALNCQCIPIACRNPAYVCKGVDIGTNHCDVDCGQGTKTTGTCAGL